MTIEERLAEVERRLCELGDRIGVPFTVTYPRNITITPVADGCSKCGLKFGRTIGYVCGQTDCPMGLGGSTSAAVELT